MKEIRLLEAQEIDARVGQVLNNDGGVAVTLLLYKDARCDMAILDELFGPFGWKRTHAVVNGNLFCTVEVKDPDTGEWVAKQDVGTESNTEPEKGQASDSFKRACVNWGIGRELYTAPRIKIELKDGEYSKGNGPVRCWQQFSVGSIAYDSARNISALTIVDRFGNVRYSFPSQNAQQGQKAGKSATSTRKTAPTPAAPSSREKAAEKYKDDQGFWMAVEGQATGRVPDGFRSSRDWFVQKRNPDNGELAYFDSMVELKKAALGA